VTGDQGRFVVGIDYDGTLAEGDSYPEVGRLDPEAVALVLRLQDAGAAVVLHTCREGESLRQVLEACREAGIEFSAVNAQVRGNEAFGRKPLCDLYLDDKAWPQKAMGRIDWQQVERWLSAEGVL
jgi:hypothetical protein